MSNFRSRFECIEEKFNQLVGNIFEGYHNDSDQDWNDRITCKWKTLAEDVFDLCDIVDRIPERI